MTARTAVLLAALAGILNSGCAMCQDHFDEYYAAYGGVHPRSDMIHGRVGSLFRPADGGPVEAGPMSPLGPDVDSAPLMEDEWNAEYGETYGDERFELPSGDTDEVPFEELPSFETPESALPSGSRLETTDIRSAFARPVSAADPLTAADPIGFWEVSDMEFPIPE